MKKVVAFLDLLGFRRHLKGNPKEAAHLIESYNTIIDSRFMDKVSSLKKDFKYPEFSKFEIDSFEYFLPFSDSIFIMSDKPNKFIQQLSTFLIDCYLFTANRYLYPTKEEDPTLVEVIHLIRSPQEIKKHKEKIHWYPTIFRCGITYGEAFPIQPLMIDMYKRTETVNLFGEAVVDAVELEELKAKGPKILCNELFFEQLNEENKIYVREYNHKTYEILWPAYKYISSDGEIELNEIDNLLGPTISLWKSINHTELSKYYFNFIEIIVQGSIRYFENVNLKSQAIEKIKQILKNDGMEAKEEILFD